nr:biotin carboxylase, chloroplastic [Ipomoea batatas]
MLRSSMAERGGSRPGKRAGGSNGVKFPAISLIQSSCRCCQLIRENGICRRDLAFAPNLSPPRLFAPTVDAQCCIPGYGFLSENALFVEMCKEHGINFIGPNPDSIRVMGDQCLPEKTMKNAGVPTSKRHSDALDVGCSSHISNVDAPDTDLSTEELGRSPLSTTKDCWFCALY